MTDQAIKSYQEAINLNTQNENNYIKLGQIYIEQSNQLESFMYLAQALAINPNSEDGILGMAHIL